MFRCNTLFWSDEEVTTFVQKPSLSLGGPKDTQVVLIKAFILGYFFHIAALDKTSVFIWIS